MDILDEMIDNVEENESDEEQEVEKNEESPKILSAKEYDKLLEEEIKQFLPRGAVKSNHHKCSRCGNDLGTVDQWFNYAIKTVHFGFTMVPQPLCKRCFHDFEDFMRAFDKK